MAEENVNFSLATTVSEGGNKRQDSPPPPRLDSLHPLAVQRDSLSFDPSPPLTEEDEYCVSAPNNQAELMWWHYRLGHAPFAHLKSLAANGEIPSRIARVRPPRCAGCLYGAMTKVPWRSKGQRNSTQPVFVTTKPGECVSVDHMRQLSRVSMANRRGHSPRRATAMPLFLWTIILTSSLSI